MTFLLVQGVHIYVAESEDNSGVEIRAISPRNVILEEMPTSIAKIVPGENGKPTLVAYAGLPNANDPVVKCKR